MFVTDSNGIAQYVTAWGADMLKQLGGTVSTAHEAAQCVSRLVCNGNPYMNEANDDFKRIYGKPTPTAEYEPGHWQRHLFDESGKPL